jgi:hypothetical protein
LAALNKSDTFVYPCPICYLDKKPEEAFLEDINAQEHDSLEAELDNYSTTVLLYLVNGRHHLSNQQYYRQPHLDGSKGCRNGAHLSFILSKV